jgi:hypothetical protein
MFIKTIIYNLKLNNMKTKTLTFGFLIAFLLVSSTNIFSQNSGFTINFDKTDFSLKKLGEFSEFDINGTEYIMETSAGKPALPYLPVNYVVPYGSEYVTIEFTYDSVLFAENITIKPTQQIIPLIPNLSLPEKVQPLKNIYKSSDPFPKTIIENTSTQKMSKYEFFTFEVSPFIYYPLENKIFLVKNLQVNISYNLNSTPSNQNRFDDGTFYNILKDEVINPEVLCFDNSNYINNNINYLIITDSSLIEAFRPLKNWKDQKGVKTEIVSTQHIYSNYQGATDQLKIKNCIQDYYENKGTLFVLLGGGVNTVPVQRVYSNAVDPADNTIPCDLYYSCFDNTFNWDGNDNKIYGEVADNIDLSPEVFISRAPVETVSHTNAFVNKTLNYEKNPPLNNFANEMVNFGIKVFTQWDGRCDAAWLTERLFDDYVDPYWSGTHHSFYEIDSSGTSYHISDSLLTSEINKGYNFMFMASHGEPNEYLHPPAVSIFDIEDVYELNNPLEQGIIVTIACFTNAFDDIIGYSTSTGYPILFDSCLSESFLRYDAGGAVAYHGSSRFGLGLAEPSSDFGPSFLHSANFFKCLFSGQPFDNKYKLGAIAAKTKIHFIAAASIDDSYRWLQFTLNVLGDTELDIFTEDPSPITLFCPDSVPLGNLQNIIINTGEPQVNICLNNGNDIYLSGETDFSGKLILVASPLSVDPIIVTASAHNKIFAVDTIYISVAENAVVILDNYSIDAQGKPGIYFGDNVNVSIELKNIGPDTAFNTQFHVSEIEDYITLNSNGDSIGSIPPGQSITKSNIINFDVSYYIPNNYDFNLNASITDNNSQRNESLNFMAYSPNIEINNVEIMCNEHNTLMSNDSANIIVKIKNTGGAPIQNLKGMLTSDLAGNPLSIYGFIDSTDQILPGNESELNFHLITTSSVNTEIPFILELTAGYYSTIGTFIIEVVDSLENFETGNFQLYPWDLSTGDSDWIIDSLNAFNGQYCARSGVVSLGEKSIIELNLNVLDDGFISFYKKTSFMAGYGNYLVFKIDSILQGYWFGNIDWSREVFPVTAGVHNFKWEYEKFNRTIDSTDWVWIDYIAFPSVTEVSAIDEVSKNPDNFSIFPNPNTGLFNIVFDSEQNENIFIEIFSLQGVSVYKENISGKHNTFTKQINLKSITKGVYLIKIQSNKTSGVRKVILN